MVALPIVAAVISLAFTVLIGIDARRRPRPDKISWLIAFGIFMVAAGAEVVGDLAGWTPTVARIYYLTGAVLVTLFLGVGELYLLFGPRISRLAPGLLIAVVALAASLVFAAPIDTARLDADHWRAIDRNGLLIIVVAISNAFGVLALAGGSIWSAWRFFRTGTHRHRMIGCLLIALGTLVVASKGYATDAGLPVDDEGFYALLAIGAAIIFAGYLETRRPDRAVPTEAVSGERLTGPLEGGTAPVGADAATVPTGGLVTRTDHMAPTPPAAEPMVATRVPVDAAAAYIETRFLPLDDAALNELATAWSAGRIASPHLTREQARRVWVLRGRLSPEGQRALDAQTLPAALQLADLYDHVFAARAEEDVGPDRGDTLTLLASRP